MQTRPIIALVGRPNVGKSTIFNRLLGRREAITSYHAGTTRDRHFGVMEWLQHSWAVVDTAGILLAEENASDELQGAIDEQIELALAEADLVALVVDVKEGIHPHDLALVARLRKHQKPIVVLVNKADNSAMRVQAEEFRRFGLETIFPISAIHGSGIGDFVDYLMEHFPSKTAEIGTGLPKVSFIGRPNVGKSTLINRILGQKRLVVSATPGTTRDSIESEYSLPDGTRFELVDTAGIRRRGKIEDGIEKFSLFRTIKTINHSDVVVLLMTIEEVPTRGDAHVAMYATEAKKRVIIALNKTDLAQQSILKQDHHKQHNIGQRFLRRFAFLQRLPYYFISAQTGEGVAELVDALAKEIQATKQGK